MQKTITFGGAVGVVDTLGGEMISYRKDGREYIWHGDSAHWSGHAPVLFPFVSSLKNNRALIDGREYEMKGKHGFARKSEFVLDAITENSASFILTANDHTLALYPYRFILRITHSLNEKGYRTEYAVTNADQRPIFFCIGGHPGFEVESSVEDYKLVFDKEEDCDLYYTDAESLISDDYKIQKRIEGKEFALCYDDYDVDALVAKDIASCGVSLVRRDNGHGIHLDFTGFHTLVLWTPPRKHSPFICLEPWNGLPAYTNESGVFEEKPLIIKLPAGDTYRVGYSVTLI